MNARLRSIIALLLVLSFGLALPAVHGQQLMIHSGSASAGVQQPAPPCHAASAPDTTSDSDGCSQCGDGDCQCQLITLSPPATLPQLIAARPQAGTNPAPRPEAANLGQLRQPWRPPSSNA